MNWFGHVCRNREPWLGAAVPGPSGKIVYSDLLVDFVVISNDETGRSYTQWWLKPEARSAVRTLDLVA